jgi:hypothetical protein
MRPVVIVEPGPTDLFPRLGVDLEGPLSLQVLGSFVAESAGLGNGFTKLPDIPISSFALHFDGGKGSLLLTASTCAGRPRSVSLRASMASTGLTARGASQRS